MKKNVLIIEDDEDIQEYYRIVLSRLNLTILRAHNGREALSLIEAGNPVDLILLDIVMPVMDGEEFFRELHKTGGAPVPVVPCSCDNDTIGRLKKEGYQFPDVFLKNEGAARLREIVGKYLGAANG